MSIININKLVTGTKLRHAIYSGEIFVLANTPAAIDLCNLAQQYITEAFHPIQPETAHHHLEVHEFVKIVAKLKSTFTNGQDTKRLLKPLIQYFQHNLDEESFFDVPRLRVVPSHDYLAAGVSYAYKPHRDTWYAGSPSQINFWMPIYSIDATQAMSIYPSYWSTAIQNNSNNFDYNYWSQIERPKAASITQTDNRQHPIALEELDLSNEIRITGTKGDLIIFSACHLHSTAINFSNRIRFSIDFRLINLADLQNKQGANNIDANAKNSILEDFIRVSDFNKLSAVCNIKELI